MNKRFLVAQRVQLKHMRVLINCIASAGMSNTDAVAINSCNLIKAVIFRRRK